MKITNMCKNPYNATARKAYYTLHKRHHDFLLNIDIEGHDDIPGKSLHIHMREDEAASIADAISQRIEDMVNTKTKRLEKMQMMTEEDCVIKAVRLITHALVLRSNINSKQILHNLEEIKEQIKEHIEMYMETIEDDIMRQQVERK